MGLVDYDNDTDDSLTLEKKDEWVKTPGEVNPGEIMTIGGVTRKVISFEKALLRELAFKKKLEELKPKSQPAAAKKPSSIQGINVSTKNGGVLGKAPQKNISHPLQRYAGESHFQRIPEKREQGVTASTRNDTGIHQNTPVAGNSCQPQKYGAESYLQRISEKRDQGVTASTRNTGVHRNTPVSDNSCKPQKHGAVSYSQQTSEKRDQGVTASTRNTGVQRNTPVTDNSCQPQKHGRGSYFQRTSEKGIQGVSTSTRNAGVYRNSPVADNPCQPQKHGAQSYFQRTSEKRDQGVTAIIGKTGAQGNTPLADNSCGPKKHAEESYFHRTPEKKEQEIIRTGVKRKDPPPNQLSLPPPQPAEQLYLTQTPEKCANTNYKCKECGIICCGFLNLHDHYQGRKHKTRVEELKIQNGGTSMGARQQLVYNIQDSPERCGGGVNVRTGPVCSSQGSEPVRKCEICNCICPGLLNYNQHINGKRHKTRLEQMKVGKHDEGGGTEPVNCEICNVVCMNEFAYKQHQAGRKHAVALQAIRSLNSSFPSV